MKSFWATFIDIWQFLSGHTGHSTLITLMTRHRCENSLEKFNLFFSPASNVISLTFTTIKASTHVEKYLGTKKISSQNYSRVEHDQL